MSLEVPNADTLSASEKTVDIWFNYLGDPKQIESSSKAVRLVRNLRRNSNSDRMQFAQRLGIRVSTVAAIEEEDEQITPQLFEMIYRNFNSRYLRGNDHEEYFLDKNDYITLSQIANYYGVTRDVAERSFKRSNDRFRDPGIGTGARKAKVIREFDGKAFPEQLIKKEMDLRSRIETDLYLQGLIDTSQCIDHLPTLISFGFSAHQLLSNWYSFTAPKFLIQQHRDERDQFIEWCCFWELLHEQGVAISYQRLNYLKNNTIPGIFTDKNRSLLKKNNSHGNYYPQAAYELLLPHYRSGLIKNVITQIPEYTDRFNEEELKRLQQTANLELPDLNTFAQEGI